MRFFALYLLIVVLLVPFMVLVTVLTIVQLPARILGRRPPFDDVAWVYLDWMDRVVG